MAREPKQIDFDTKVGQQIVSLRDDEGYKWDQISEAVDIPIGKSMLIYSFFKLPKKDRIKNPTAADVVRLRNDGLSWGDISVRVGWPESSCRSQFEEATGKSTKGNRIGKGGRYPNGEARPEGAVKATKSAKKAAAPAKKAAAKATANRKQVLDGMNAEEVKAAITGFAIKVSTDDGDEVIRVKTVKKVTATTVVLADETGQGRTLKRAGVFAISKKPAL